MAQADNYQPDMPLEITYNTLASILMSQYDPTKIFKMRAKRSGNYVYWSCSGQPDITGTVSGYTPSELSDIVIIQ